MRPRKDSGFTLIEVLISMFIFALISVGATSALTTSLQGKAQMNERLSAIQNIESMRAILRSDFARIELRELRDPYGGAQPYVLSGGVDDLLTFTRSGRSNPGGLEPRSEFQRVSYVFENGNLIRRSLNQLNPAPQTQSRDQVLISGLQSADIIFQIRRSAGSVAYAQTTNFSADTYPKDTLLIVPGQEKDLPALATLDLIFENGDELTQHFELAL